MIKRAFQANRCTTPATVTQTSTDTHISTDAPETRLTSDQMLGVINLSPCMCV